MKFALFVGLILLALLLPACQSSQTTPSLSSPTQTLTPSSTSTPPLNQTTTTSPPTTTITSSTSSASDIISNQSTYNGKVVTITGQAFLTGSPPKVLLDGKSGVNITGNTATLEKGFYSLTGIYDADTNTLNVTDAVKQEVKYQAIETAKTLGIDLIPTSVEGLVATPPKEVANQLSSYLNIPYMPKDTPIYPYVVYTQNGFYLVLSDTNILLPAKFTFLYSGKDYSFTFCAGEVKGVLVKTPIDKIDFGSKWQPDEFGGIIIAESIKELTSVPTTVKNINANPANYVFKRVSISGSYIVTTATIDYSDIKAPMGQGILADSFSDFFSEDSKLRLETIDPNQKVWQLRESTVTGTVIYPTEQILKYLDYSPPIAKAQIMQNLKPALIVDTLADDIVSVANISDLNPIIGNPSKYWGKVVQFDGYALGINYPLKKVGEAILNTEVPLNLNLLAIGIADKPDIGSQLAIVGLNNELIDETREVIKGRYKFGVAVSQIPEELVSGLPYADTAFFLLSKEELPIEIPPLELYNLNVSISPSATGTVSPLGGKFESGTMVTLNAVSAPGYLFDYWSGDASGTDNPITIIMDSDKSVTAHFRLIF